MDQQLHQSLGSQVTANQGYGQQGYGQPGQPGQEDLPPPPPELMDRTFGQQQAQPGRCILKQPNTNVSILQTIQR